MWIQGEVRMSFLSNILTSVKKKSAEIKERKEFLDMVEQNAKPIRREAYMKQMFKEVVEEGIQKAKLDAEARTPKKKSPQDFGFGSGLEDPYKFMRPKEETTKLTKNKK